MVESTTNPGKRKQREANLEFLAGINLDFAPLLTVQEVMHYVAERLATFLHLSRCVFSIIDEAQDRVEAVYEYLSDEKLPSLLGFHRISENITEEGRRHYNAGMPVVLNNMTDSRMVEAPTQRLTDLGIGSLVVLPYLEAGEWKFLLTVARAEESAWRSDEIALLQELTSRIYIRMERARVEEALLKSEEKYRTLFTSIDQGFTLCELIRNTEGKGIDFYMLEVNPTYEKQTGISKDMVLGKAILQVFPSLEKWIDTYAAVVDNQCPVVFEHYFEDTDRWFAIKAYPVEKERFAVLFSNITERKQAEEKIKESEKQLEQKVILRTEQLLEKNIELKKMNDELEAFTYVSSHDLQEPLRKIQTFARRIVDNEKEQLSDNAKDYFNRMQDAASRMQTLLEDLIAFSHISTSERKFEKTNLSKIVDEVKEAFKEVMEEKNASISAVEMCEANIIPFQFHQLMYNLIGNALKFSKPDVPPHIFIKSTIAKGSELNYEKLLPENDYCHISVSDNSIGFEKHFSEKIFGVFQKLHARSEYTGTGIGLAIVKKIVDNHNGIITAESELGKGTTFNIYLPV